MKLANIAIVSSSGDGISIQKKCYSKDQRISDYLQKPFTKDQLLTIVEKHIYK